VNSGGALAEFTTPEERSTAWPPIARSVGYDPHSTWLGWAAECGLMGLGAWVLLYGFVLNTLWRQPPASLPRLAGCTMCRFALSGLAVEINHLKFVWCFLGLALAAERSRRDETR
jgi:O-antigen ligase